MDYPTRAAWEKRQKEMDYILLNLKKVWMMAPELRFGQLLFNLGYIRKEEEHMNTFSVADPYAYLDKVLDRLLTETLSGNTPFGQNLLARHSNQHVLQPFQEKIGEIPSGESREGSAG